MLINWMSPVIEHRTYIQYHIPYTWKTPSWIEYLIPYSWTYAFTCWSWIPYTLFMMVGRPDQSFQRERAAFFPPDCTSPTQFDHWWLSSVHELLCLLIWSIAIEHLHHESVCDQSQLNASMRVCVINRNWTPPWIACWPINQLINWSTSTPWLADHLINWSTSTPWLADQLINWLRLTWSTSSTSTSWINFDSLICWPN